LNQAEAHRKQALARVRTNAWYAGIAAALMILFGYGVGLVFASEGWLANLAGKTILYTLQGGGILLALVAVLCLMGLPQALYLDAFVSTLIGLAFILGSLGRVIGGDSFALFYGLLGAMFLHSAVRNYRDASAASAFDAGEGRPRWQDEPPRPPKRSAASDLLERLRGPEDPKATPLRFEPPADETPPPEAHASSGPAESSPESAPQPASQPPGPPAASPARSSSETPPPSGALAAQAGPAAPESAQAPGQEPTAPRIATPKSESEPEPAAPPPGGFLAALAKEKQDEQQQPDHG